MGEIVVLVSANTEWAGLRLLFPGAVGHVTPFGEMFRAKIALPGKGILPVLFVHGGWGKIAAAASTQYCIQRWKPELIVNLGTCGGFAGAIERGTVILVERTLVYDIIEQMDDHVAVIEHYTSEIDLSWVGENPPTAVQRGMLVSGDRDLLPEDVPRLAQVYGARAGDWESGAIAWVAARNQTPCLILRAVSDLVGEHGGEAYGSMDVFTQAARELMVRLVTDLPLWLARWKTAQGD